MWKMKHRLLHESTLHIKLCVDLFMLMVLKLLRQYFSIQVTMKKSWNNDYDLRTAVPCWSAPCVAAKLILVPSNTDFRALQSLYFQHVLVPNIPGLWAISTKQVQRFQTVSKALFEVWLFQIDFKYVQNFKHRGSCLNAAICASERMLIGNVGEGKWDNRFPPRSLSAAVFLFYPSLCAAQLRSRFHWLNLNQENQLCPHPHL